MKRRLLQNENVSLRIQNWGGMHHRKTHNDKKRTSTSLKVKEEGRLGEESLATLFAASLCYQYDYGLI